MTWRPAALILGLAWLGCTSVCLGQEDGERANRRGNAERREGARPVRRRNAEGRGGPMAGEELRDFVEQVMPGRFEQIMALRRTNPDRFRQTVMSLMQKKRQLDELKERDPAAYERAVTQMGLEAEVREIAEAARKADNEEGKKAAKDKLADAVGQLFDIQCETLQQEIQEQTQRIEEMKQLLEKRRAAKEKIVQRRVDELTGDDAVLRWEIGWGREAGRRAERPNAGRRFEGRGRDGQPRPPFMR